MAEREGGERGTSLGHVQNILAFVIGCDLVCVLSAVGAQSKSNASYL